MLDPTSATCVAIGVTFAQSIRAWRRRWALTQPAAAAALGVNARSLENWEQGRAKPSPLARQSLKTKLQSPPCSSPN